MLFRMTGDVESEILANIARQAEIQGYIEKGAINAFEAIQTMKQVKRQAELDLKSAQ